MERSLGKPRIVIAAEPALFREGLRTLLEADRQFLVVYEARDAQEAVRHTRELRPNVLMLDLALPGLPLDQSTGESAVSSATAIIVLANAIDPQTIASTLAVGARGIVLKSASSATLLRAVRAVVTGDCWVDRESVPDLAAALNRRNGVGKERAQRPRDFGLTNRECEIVSAVAAAYANKDIAQKFAISETTVKHHLTHIFEKVGVSTRLELALFALHNGFVREPPRPHA